MCRSSLPHHCFAVVAFCMKNNTLAASVSHHQESRFPSILDAYTIHIPSHFSQGPLERRLSGAETGSFLHKVTNGNMGNLLPSAVMPIERHGRRFGQYIHSPMWNEPCTQNSEAKEAKSSPRLTMEKKAALILRQLMMENGPALQALHSTITEKRGRQVHFNHMTTSCLGQGALLRHHCPLVA